MTPVSTASKGVDRIGAVLRYRSTVEKERGHREAVCRSFDYHAIDVADLVLEEAVGPGWMPIVRDMHGVLIGFDPDYRLFEVKESQGRLHVQAQFAPQAADPCFVVVATAVEQAAEACELCGEPGLLKVGRPYWKTLCDPCFRIDREIASEKGERFAELRLARLLSGDPRFPTPEAIIACFPDNPRRCGGRMASAEGHSYPQNGSQDARIRE
jgi:hypothetical protein